MAAIVYNRRQ